MNYNFLDLVQHVTNTANINNVKINLSPTKTIPYPIGGFPCNGYFIDYGNPQLGVAIDKPTEEWIMVLSHESSHMDQWSEKSSVWINNFIDNKESIDYVQEWLDGKEYPNVVLSDLIKRSIDVELDCEKRTMEKVKKYNLEVNLKEEIQKANSYIIFYTIMKDIRKWYLPGKAPYQIKEIWSTLPDNFDIDYFNVSEETKELYIKHMF